jgi:hypothetical protein
MKTKIAGVVAVVCGALVVMPMQSALAAHSIGGHAEQCIGSSNKAYDAVDVAVGGVGSDSPRNYLAAASGRVTVTTSCHKAGRIRAIRVQIDSVTLRQRMNSTITILRAQAGPYTHRNGSVSLTTHGWHAPCGAVMQATVGFSVRYSDGSLASGGYLRGGGFVRC